MTTPQPKPTKAERIKELQEARESSTRYPWERQLYESRKAFEAFCIYRDMGPARSLVKVGRELGKSTQLVERWSAKWNWVERTAEWGDDQDRELRRTQTDDIKKMNERHANLAAALQGKVIEKLQSVMPDPVTKTIHPDVERMTMVSLSRLVEVGVKVERQARGEAGELVEEKVESTGHLAHLTTEELEQLERIHDNAAERAKVDQD